MVHTCPLVSFGTHVPDSHAWPAAHSWAVVHEEGQLVPPLHANAPHVPAAPGGSVVQVPSASAPREAVQTSQAPPQAALQHTPSEQFPEAHWPPRLHAVPGAWAPVQTPPVQFPEAHCPGRLQGAPEASLGAHAVPSQ